MTTGWRTGQGLRGRSPVKLLYRINGGDVGAGDRSPATVDGDPREAGARLGLHLEEAKLRLSERNSGHRARKHRDWSEDGDSAGGFDAARTAARAAPASATSAAAPAAPAATPTRAPTTGARAEVATAAAGVGPSPEAAGARRVGARAAGGGRRGVRSDSED